MKMKLLIAIVPVLSFGGVSQLRASAPGILEQSGVRGGLVVHLGCGDGRLTAALHANDRYLVHGLDRSAENIEAARRHIRAAGLSGRVSVELLETKGLPYADNLVNLIVASGDGLKVPKREIERVLCPGGVAVAAGPAEGGAKMKTLVRKAWPEEIDEWTHFLHDASGNAVARDSRVGPPRHLQWVSGPKRTRDHDALASFTTMTSANGRVFYILDEGPTSQIHRPPRWSLVARDGFNGVPLWRREIESWVTHLYNFRAGPVQLTRRLVSVGDRVYVTLGFDAAVTALDAATGETLETFEGSKNTEEIIVEDGVLLAVLGDPSIFNEEAPKIDGYWETVGEREGSIAKSVTAYQADTGKLLWKKSDPGLSSLVPLSLCAGGGRAFYLDGEKLHCLSLKTGKPEWSAPFGLAGQFLRNYAPTVVLHEDVIVCLSTDKLVAFSVDDGRVLWNKDQGYLGFGSPGDLFIIDDLVWTFPGRAGIRYASKDKVMGAPGKEFVAFDLHTGEAKREIAKNDVWPGGHHHRCYRNKATEKFAVCGRRGLEFVDLTGGDEHVINWWARGICQYGVMPCNGMVYVPPDPCRCFSGIKVDGLLVLAPAAESDGRGKAAEEPLRKGPAFRKHAGAAKRGGPASPEDWPTYRHDPARSGCAGSDLPADVKQVWQTGLGDGLLSGVVAAGDRLWVSVVDRHVVHCLDAESGRKLWSFTAGGRVDSPPTISAGLAVFGSRDGRVYAVDAEDGRLAWVFRAGPHDRRVIDEGRLESAWPVHGSVLVEDGVVYFAAGRSSFMDGGIHLYALDLGSGKVLHETSEDSAPVHDNNSGVLVDILVSDGTSISMRQLSYDRQLEKSGRGKSSSFAASTGFLEDEWVHRLSWSKDRASGNLLVFDQQFVYGAQSQYSGWKKNKQNWPTTHSGHLHQKYSRYEPSWFPVGNRVFGRPRVAGKKAGKKKPKPAVDEQAGGWSMDRPIQVRSLVLAGDVLFAAGWPDAVEIPGKLDPGAGEPVSQEPTMWAISAKDGRTLAEYELGALPVFDGAAVARGRLFVPLQDGKVVCFGNSSK